MGDSPPARQAEKSRAEEPLFRIIQVSSALGIGAMALFLYSLKQVNPRVVLEWTPGSLIAFAIGVAVSWLFWRGVARKATRQGRFLAYGSGVAIVAGTLFGFGYALRNVSSAKTREVALGALLAVSALIGVGIVLKLIMRFLEQDHRRHSNTDPD